MLTLVATTAMLRTRPLCMARVVYVGRSRACAGRRGPAVVMDEQQYNLAATAYDILEGREFRRDALLQYGVFQRSQQLRILFFRLAQCGAALVAVPFEDGPELAPLACTGAAKVAEAEGWLWQPTDLSAWRGYFLELLSNAATPARAADEGAFFALSLRGRSCASGVGAE